MLFVAGAATGAVAHEPVHAVWAVARVEGAARRAAVVSARISFLMGGSCYLVKRLRSMDSPIDL